MATTHNRDRFKRVEKMKTVLAATIHDPEPRLLKLLRDHGHQLGMESETIVVGYSPPTHPSMVEAFEGLGFITVAGGKSVRSVYSTALERSLKESPNHVFYCDLDRLLHWIRAYPEEYRRTRRKALEYEFLMVGRTPRAFQTHPKTQTCTEAIANLIASRALGFEDTRDMIGACWGLSNSLVQLLVSTPMRNSTGFFCGWPVIAWRKSLNKAYVEVEGLEWETPDRYEREVAAEGYEKWLRDFMTQREWERRTLMLRDLTETLLDLIL